MNEIKTANEVVTLQDVHTTIESQLKRRGFQAKEDDFLFQIRGRYVTIDLTSVMDYPKSRELGKSACTVTLSASPCFMGNLPVEELNVMADELKAAALVVERMNDRLSDVAVVSE